VRTLTPRRVCALCERKIKYKERLCPQHLNEYKDQLTEPWLRGIIEESNYQWNVARRDTRPDYHGEVLMGDDAIRQKEVEQERAGKARHRGPGGALWKPETND
jgi:hypothetical protein